ncbi:Uncharacterised protein [Streptococcus pneumoniae]|nr:Uncharacterised protein [Streptococcus pneumoniae]CIW58020.1 Uncharacterised protein [Streptococcus pneumoniae]CJG80399.1 Uncharacterised protein [Streptococcus pneumoniae]
MVHFIEIFAFLDQILDMNLLNLNPFVLGQEIVFQARHKTFSVATQTNIN